MHEKPLIHINNIVNHVSPYSDTFQAARGEIINYKTHDLRYCFLLLEGAATLNRRGDGMILSSQEAPFILGVSNQLSSSDNLYVRILEPSRIAQLPLERFNLLIAKYGLWKDFCHLLVFTASTVYEKCTAASSMSSVEIIIFQLKQLMLEPERIRMTTTAANYILNRTYLSRSGIMRILSQLRDTGGIVLQRGVLIDIHQLPEK